MDEWPKIVMVGKIGIPVHDWEEMDEVIRRYGENVRVDSSEQTTQTEAPSPKQTSTRAAWLSHTDRTILEQFVEGGSRGVTTSQIGPALGKQGKGIRVALESWSRKIGLVTEAGASAFEPIQRADGRGFRLLDVYLQAARSMLGL